jgi:hypothetical protein
MATQVAILTRKMTFMATRAAILTRKATFMVSRARERFPRRLDATPRSPSRSRHAQVSRHRSLP